MSKLLVTVIFSALFSMSAFSQTVCSSVYSVGLGHLFKGEVDTIEEEHSMDIIVENNMHRIEFDEAGNLLVIDKVLETEVSMKNISTDERLLYM